MTWWYWSLAGFDLFVDAGPVDLADVDFLGRDFPEEGVGVGAPAAGMSTYWLLRAQ